MKNLANFLLFQAGWFATVMTAGEGHMWLGPLVVALIVAVHLALFSRPEERTYELRYILVVGLVGALADTVLRQLGATSYPSSEATWAFATAPPWIVSLWVLFAILPHHSLGWLRGRAWLAALLGAIGGPLSYVGGTSFGAVEVGDRPVFTLGALAVEYALFTPLLLAFARARPRESQRAQA